MLGKIEKYATVLFVILFVPPSSAFVSVLYNTLEDHSSGPNSVTFSQAKSANRLHPVSRLAASPPPDSLKLAMTSLSTVDRIKLFQHWLTTSRKLLLPFKSFIQEARLAGGGTHYVPLIFAAEFDFTSPSPRKPLPRRPISLDNQEIYEKLKDVATLLGTTTSGDRKSFRQMPPRVGK
ncbi:hypothetical protein BV898_05270 [Hypsibius exemplaris]|uniref:Uncharacterized protein n=1 Tax=Hypsibius exemplaris TaxID=2072580 RepID=A0A1W0WZN5_HYPEX|nr:hypothetical protein BV898_05270 [Hypsibius exemplaris]